MEIDLALLADAATVDASGKLNILGVFDRIGARGLPLKYGRVTLVLRFSAGLEDAGSHDLVLKMRAPDGGEMVNLNGKIQLGPGPMSQGGRMMVPHVLNLDGLVFKEAGVYHFDLSLDGEHAVSIPLHVAQMGRPRPDVPVAQA
jgi:hypothetical protein